MQVTVNLAVVPEALPVGSGNPCPQACPWLSAADFAGMSSHLVLMVEAFALTVRGSGSQLLTTGWCGSYTGTACGHVSWRRVVSSLETYAIEMSQAGAMVLLSCMVMDKPEPHSVQHRALNHCCPQVL